MATSANLPALLALALGLFYVAAAAGELRRPGQWQRAIDALAESPLLQLLGGGMALGVGAMLVALVPPRTGDWLNLWLFALGCVALLEGVSILVMPERMTLLSRAIMARGSRSVALLTLLLGVAFGLAGLIRI